MKLTVQSMCELAKIATSLAREGYELDEVLDIPLAVPVEGVKEAKEVSASAYARVTPVLPFRDAQGRVIPRKRKRGRSPLSSAEHSLVIETARSASIDSTAEMLGIAPNTVRRVLGR